MRKIELCRGSLSRNALLCIVGKNGTGKTTLAKAVQHFVQADTFSRTTSDGVLREDSAVRYQLGDQHFEFRFDSALGTLSSRAQVPRRLKNLISVELPIPFGQRFRSFPQLAEADDQIRRAITLEDDSRPEELIAFLSNIYGEDRFSNLKEVRFAKGHCCYFIDKDGRYVREDYFSSGEFFLINLFRRLREGKKLVFIDEIDIGLDAAAQARLVPTLRQMCGREQVNLVFTSHSLALMQTLGEGELVYLEPEGSCYTLTERSPAYVKSLLFGFQGYDRHILTEDEEISLMVRYLVALHCQPCIYQYIAIEVGGAGQVVSLLQRNRQDGILGPSDAVIAVLDGDQADGGNATGPQVFCLPIQSVEKEFERAYDGGDLPAGLPASIYASIKPGKGRAKALYKAFLRGRVMSAQEIVTLVCDRHAVAFKDFALTVLKPLLCKR